MKKSIILLFGLLIATSSCKEEIDELFLNPDGSTTTKIEYLFSGALTQNGAGLRVGYNPSGYYLILQGIGPWTQVVANDANDAKMMDLVSNAINNSWGAYYVGFMSKVAEMQILYDELPDEDRANYDVYMHLIKIVAANGTSKITDLYGDVPYSEAFRSRAPEQVLFPKFDNQQAIYTAILADLKAASAFLSSFTLNDSSEHKALATQDLLNHGDIDKWLKLSNSLRLRFAMRISDADASLASATVSEVANAPLVLTNADNIFVDAASPNGLNTRTGADGQNFIGRAFNDRQNRTFAGELMVDLMNAANDPRRAYYFTKNADDEYVGVPSSPADIAPISQDINIDNYSKISEEMVLDNLYHPGIVITAAEVYFLLAEAAMKGFDGGDANTYYDTALRLSVDFYYDMVALNPDANPAMPVAAEVDDFINNSTFAYDGTMEQLATQKWIYLGVIQAHEAYADYRRFDFPTLQENIPEGGGAALVVPTRVTIPDSEKVRNEENYQAVKANDTPYNKVWWDVN